MTDGDELAEIKRQLHALEMKNFTLRSLVVDLLSSDMILAGVAVSLAADDFTKAREAIEELRDRQVKAYKRLEEDFEQL